MLDNIIMEGVKSISHSQTGYNLCSVLEAHRTQLLNLAVIFALNAVSTTLGNLKTMLLNRARDSYLIYGTTFIDALVCALTLKFIANFSSVICIFAFALGRLCGVRLANRIENKLAFGILEVNVYKHPEEGIALADKLRDEGYSVTTYIGHGINGKERLDLTIIIPRRELGVLEILWRQSQYDYQRRHKKPMEI
jgi:uncharacterized protein YebE (UPF0316 family)